MYMAKTGLALASLAAGVAAQAIDFAAVGSAQDVDGFTDPPTHDTPAAWTDPVNCHKSAINAPLDCRNRDSYIGLEIFTKGPFSVSRCAERCEAQAAYNHIHQRPNTPRPCRFFNTYLLFKNSLENPRGQFCSMYTETWNTTYATNDGQWSGNDLYFVRESYISSHIANPGDCPVPISSPSLSSSPARSTSEITTRTLHLSSSEGAPPPSSAPVTTGFTTRTIHPSSSAAGPPPPPHETSVAPPPHESTSTAPHHESTSVVPPHVSTSAPHVSTSEAPHVSTSGAPHVSTETPPHVSTEAPPHVSSSAAPPHESTSEARHVSTSSAVPPHLSTSVAPPPHESTSAEAHTSSVAPPPPHGSTSVAPPPHESTSVAPPPHGSTTAEAHTSSPAPPPPHGSTTAEAHTSSAAPPPPHDSITPGFSTTHAVVTQTFTTRGFFDTTITSTVTSAGRLPSTTLLTRTTPATPTASGGATQCGISGFFNFDKPAYLTSISPCSGPEDAQYFCKNEPGCKSYSHSAARNVCGLYGTSAREADSHDASHFPCRIWDMDCVL